MSHRHFCDAGWTLLGLRGDRGPSIDWTIRTNPLPMYEARCSHG